MAKYDRVRITCPTAGDSMVLSMGDDRLKRALLKLYGCAFEHQTAAAIEAGHRLQEGQAVTKGGWTFEPIEAGE